jgi:hypothetical protein
MRTYDKLLNIYRLSWIAPLTIVLIGIAVVALRADDISGAVSKAEASKQDGTHTPMRTQTNAHPAPT